VPQILAPLASGQTVEPPCRGSVLRDALGFTGECGCGIALPVLVRGRLMGAFTIFSEQPLGFHLRESALTLREQAALALESAELSADLHRRRAERRFSALIEHSSGVITIVDEAGTITYQAPSAEQLLGYHPDQLTGTKLTDLIHPQDRPRAHAFLSDALARHGASAPVEWRMLRADGSWRVFENVGNA
jgi:PAS domain S-box-containing protein